MEFQFNPGSPPACDLCHKAPAKIQFVEQKGTEVKKVALCEGCAAKQGITQEGSSLSFNLPSLLAALSSTGNTDRPRGVRTCPKCGLTDEEFRKTGRLGCADCYQGFRDLVLPIIKRVQSGSQHRGLTPENRASDPRQDDIPALKKRLDGCVEREEYEKAAELRDRIRAAQSEEQ